MGDIIALVVAGIALIGLLVQHFTIISGIKERLSSQETKMELFWGAMQAKTIEMLHSPTNHIKDALLEKLQAGTYSRDDACDLKTLLQDEMTGKAVTGGVALAYCLMIGRLEQICFDFDRGKR